MTSSTSGAGSGDTPSGGSSGRTTKTVTPEVIALDEADVDLAQANLTTAQADVGDADLVSTIGGTVGSVSLTAGQSVAAGSPSATPQIVVVGSGSDFEAATTVDVTKIKEIHLGQEAVVTPDSSSVPEDGTITGIGVQGTSTTSSTTYPVTVSFQSDSAGSFSGGGASVQIVTGTARGVTTVPSSAVHTVGTTRYVELVDGGTTKTTRVTVGTVGAVRTEITSGVHVGQDVSLADMSEPVPTSSTTTTRSGLAGLSGTGGFGSFGGTGGFGGGGFGGGGFGGAGFSRAAG